MEENTSTSGTVDNYLVEQIIPKNRVSLLAGISSAGKTRFAVPALQEWSEGKPFLEHQSYPVPWGIVSSDRPLKDCLDSYNSMGLDLEKLKIISAFGAKKIPDYEIIEKIKNLELQMVFWDGFDMLVDNPNSHAEVRDFLSRMTGYCEQCSMSILGSVGVPKMRIGQEYDNPRQMVAGSSVWERCTSTNLVIVPHDPADVGNALRTMHVCLKNSQSFKTEGRFDSAGILRFKKPRFSL